MRFINGKKIARKINETTKREIAGLKRWPRLAIILIGDDPASKIYTDIKVKRAQEIGISIKKLIFDKKVSQTEILEAIGKLNQNSQIDGILVQLPLPKGISADKIINSIDSEKDVDGLLKTSPFDSPFILSIWRAIQETKVELSQKRILALVNSRIFGKRLQDFFNKQGIRLDYLLRESDCLKELRQADIVITACGEPNLIGASRIKHGAILIDGGVSRQDKKIKGDINTEGVKEKAAWLAPVPGGLGPITVAFLLKNTARAFVDSDKK